MHHRTSIRQIVMATALVVAAVVLSTGVGAWAVEGDASNSRRADPASAAANPPPENPATAWPGRPPSRVLEQARERRLRQAARAAEQAHAAREHRGQERASRSTSYSGDSKRIAARLMADRYGWGADQFSCLAVLWGKESGWDVHAANSSGAYGIPQALPGSKMSAYGDDWRDNPVTQIEWGLAYIDDSYGTPCSAWSTFQSKGWY